jgi:hypothetical protein
MRRFQAAWLILIETNLAVFLNAPAKWNTFCLAALFLAGKVDITVAAQPWSYTTFP